MSASQSSESQRSTAPTVLVVEDRDSTREFMSQALRDADYEVKAAASLPDARALVERHMLDLVFLDLKLGPDDGRLLLDDLQAVAPDVPVIIVTSDNTAQTAVELLRRGAYDYAVKKSLDADTLQHMAARGIELCTARRRLGVLKDVQDREGPTWDVGETPRMKMVENLVNKFAPATSGVLIQGESGTGKEVVAHALHDRSPRADNAFIALNCAAVPEHLLESELFGHEKGAFTGAVGTRRGMLELAHGGTLFLDEVTMMSPEMQAKLLRALQEFRFRRVGGHKEIKVDVRLVAASNQNVLDAIGEGTFREDLFFRLCVVTIELPPLRQRAADIPFFVERFIHEMRGETKSDVSGATDAAMWALCRYGWPGNIRELRNVIERAVILAAGEGEIDVAHLPAGVRDAGASAVRDGRNGHRAGPNGASPEEAMLDGRLPGELPEDGLDMKGVQAEWERTLIEQALGRTGGNQSAAARMLGLTRDELRYRVDKYAVPTCG